MTGFVHLHTHTEHSALDGLSKVDEKFVEAVVQRGQDAVAITDHGSLGGALRLIKATKGSGVKPILGEELYVAIGSRDERNAIQVPRNDGEGMAGDEDPEAFKMATGTATKRKAYEHITVLARNKAGWRNLVLMHNKAQDSYWQKPRVDYDLLAEHAEGLVVLTGCLAGPVAGPLSRADKRLADTNLAMLVERHGRDNVFVEMMDHGIGAEQSILEDLNALAKKYKVEAVATNDSHYTHAEDAKAHDALLCVQTHSRLKDTNRFRFNGHGYHLRTEQEMLQVRTESWWADAVHNSVAIAQSIEDDVLGDDGKFKLPKFPLLPAEFETSEQFLHHLMLQGAQERYETDNQGRLPSQVRSRLRREYDVICQMGMADYMLIVWEMINWARAQGIVVGPGRGSAAGSIAAYVLGITKVEPIGNRLLFERFLDPTRIEMPDVDTDFEGQRRHEVHAHLLKVYGADRVARIGQRGILRTKAALERAASALSLDVHASKLKSLVPGSEASPMKFAELDTRPEIARPFWEYVDGDAEAQQIVDLARKFEGVTRSVGHHPCGVLVSDRDLTPVMPMRYERGKDGEPVPNSLRIVEWDGGNLGDLGYLKLDVLGIKNLDQIARAVRYIEQSTGEQVDVTNLQAGCGDERDGNTWRLIGEGKTSAVFQLSSRGMTELAMSVQPDCLDDLTALVALYRPGPMKAGMHTRYANRKNGLEDTSIDYLTTVPSEKSVIEPVLETSMGVILYQEDLMMLGEVVGGLDDGWKNRLRKAFSKKNADEMEAVHKRFTAGALAGENPSGTVFSQGTLDRLWETFEGSAEYLFNRSHAAAYGQVAYITAYLKSNWPVEYGAAVLAQTTSDHERAEMFSALRLEGIEILAPDVNLSAPDTEPVNGAVVLGLEEIKGMSKAGAEAIYLERTNGGEYDSLHDLLSRVDGAQSDGRKSLSSKDIDALIESGALDRFGSRLGLLLTSRGAHGANVPVFEANLCPLDEARRQRVRLGLNLGEHPLKTLESQVRAKLDESGTRARNVRALQNASNKAMYFVVGVVASVTLRNYSRGKLANVRVESSDGFQQELTIWDSELQRFIAEDALPKVGDIALFTVRASIRTRQVEIEDPETGESRLEERTITSFSVDRAQVFDVGQGASWSVDAPSLKDAMMHTSGVAGTDTLAVGAFDPWLLETGDSITSV